MSLKSLVVSDTAFRSKEISRILEITRVDVTIDEKYAIESNPSLSLLPYDLVIIAINTLDRAILISEEISRLLPIAKTIFLFESSSNFSYLFGSTMERMVDWMLTYDNIDNLSRIVGEIFDAKYCVVKKTSTNISFTERELNIIKLIQMDMSSPAIQVVLAISERTFIRHISEIGLKMECNGRGSIGVRSFSMLGDLRD
jgi:DNA-binding CsgD family transcriptional regulator